MREKNHLRSVGIATRGLCTRLPHVTDLSDRLLMQDFFSFLQGLDFN